MSEGTDAADSKRWADGDREVTLHRFRALTDAVDGGVYQLDATGRFVDVDDAFVALTGYARADLLGARCSLVFDDADRLESATDRALEAGDGSTPLDVAVETATGDALDCTVRVSLLTEGEECTGTIGVVRDVSERNARERALEESEQRYRTLIDHFPGSVGLYDESVEYTFVGGELLDTLEIASEDVIGTPIGERYPDDVPAGVEPTFRAVFEGESNAFETRSHDRDLWAHTLPVRNTDGEILAGMLLVQDISERKAYQRQIETSNEQLEQFAYAASHDLQEPLRMVSSYLQLIERRYDDVLDADGREFIAYAVDGAERMSEMVEALLRYSRVETRDASFEPVDLNAVLEDVLDDLRVKIDETDAEITAASLPRVSGDCSQLRQLFQNLLCNAIIYSGDDPPRVSVSAEPDGSTWIVAVRDDGIGIDPNHRDRIFDVFGRLHSYEEYAGTGIGLALCARIVEHHGGGIRVDSELGEGSTFFVTLRDARST